MGKNAIWHGDCLELMANIPDGSVDMVLCDLPYGTTACKWDAVLPFDRLWAAYKRVIKPGGTIALFGSEPFSSALRVSNIKWFKYDWIWDKVRPSGFQIAKYVPMKRHEIISIFCEESPTWYPIMELRDKPVRGCARIASDSSPLKNMDGVARVYTHKYPQSILEFYKKSDGKYVHPTQKPVALCEYLIKTYTLPGQTVLDSCAGSGTTGVASINTNRRYILIEKEQKYYDICVKRCAKASLNLLSTNDMAV